MNLANDFRAQSDVIGVVLLLALVITSVGILGVVGMTSVADSREQVGVERAINTMALFDSRAALVGLGDADTQSVTFGRGEGSFDVRPDSGWLRISHHNYSGNGNTETVYNASLGAFVYEAGDTEIAYQGGGVWRRGAGSGGLMVSPPEFHYRDATLTLPIVRIVDQANPTSGDSQAIVRPVERGRHIFPNTSASSDGLDEIGAPYDPNGAGNELDYTNPIRNGTVTITVHSQYYLGWKKYFEERTEGDVDIYTNRNEVDLTLETVGGSIGDFNMPMEGNHLDVDGIANDHPVSDWEMTLKDDPHFQNAHWSMYVDKPGEEFEVHIHSEDKCNGGTFGGDLDLSLYYYNDAGSTTIHEEWQNQNIDPSTNPDFEVNCSTQELWMDLQGTTDLEYGDIQWTGNDNKWYYGSTLKSTNAPSPSTSFGTHPVDTGNYSDGDRVSVEFLINHYMGLLSQPYDLTVTDGPGGSSRVDESDSYGTLTYDTSTSRYLTYLHITENEVVIETK